jgi:hypothetical protein
LPQETVPTATGERGSDGDANRKLSLVGPEGRMRGNFVAGGCMTTSSNACLFFENFFERFGVEDAFRPAV